MNFKEGWEHTETILNPFPMGKFHLPSTSERGDTVYRDKRLHMEFQVRDGKRRIGCRFQNFYKGKPFGFNIGYGFGDTSKASENILFYDGVAHKLDDVTFHIPKDSYMSPWTITSSDGRFEMEFVPVLDRAARTAALVLIHNLLQQMDSVEWE